MQSKYQSVHMHMSLETLKQEEFWLSCHLTDRPPPSCWIQITTINVSVCVDSKGKSWVGECERVRQRMSEDKETRSVAALKRKSGVVV